MNLPKRKNPRLPQYDYAQPGYYFITICSDKKKCIFSRIISSDTAFENHLTSAGKAVEEELNGLPARFPGVTVDKYVIMPNHIHAIICITAHNGKTISDIVRAFKSLSGIRCNAILNTQTVFQTSFHDHIIRNQADYERIWRYIDGNPMRWNKDCFYVP